MSHRILPAALLLCTLTAACGELPTGSDSQARPAGPAYDGGYTMGSGYSAASSGIGSGDVAADDDGGLGLGSGNSGDTSSTTSSTGDTAERGGYTMGSGG